MLDVADGLDYLHSMQPRIIHGDLKAVSAINQGTSVTRHLCRSMSWSRMSTVPVWLISDYLRRLILKCSTSHRSPRSMLGEPFDGLRQRSLKENNLSTLQAAIYILLLAFRTRYFAYRLVCYRLFIPSASRFFPALSHSTKSMIML